MTNNLDQTIKLLEFVGNNGITNHKLIHQIKTSHLLSKTTRKSRNNNWSRAENQDRSLKLHKIII